MQEEQLHKSPEHSEIEALAEQIYISSGRGPGRDLENWLMAEAQLKERRQPSVATVRKENHLSAPTRKPQEPRTPEPRKKNGSKNGVSAAASSDRNKQFLNTDAAPVSAAGASAF